MKNAEWIWLDKQSKSDEYGAFYDSFTLDRLTEVHMQISVAGDYNVYVNGALAGFGQYADFAHYKVYDTLDITPYVKEGENEVLVVAWYIGKSFSTYRDCGTGLLFKVYAGDEVLSYSRAGMRSSIANGYISHLNKVITVQLGYSYRYDTRVQEYAWKEAVAVQGFGKNIKERPNEKLPLGDFLYGKCIDAHKRLYDLGVESCGFLAIKFKAKSGEKVTIAYGEHIADGGVRYAIDGRDFTVELIGNGEYTEFLGSFRRLGCRYLQIVEGAPEIEYIGIRDTSYPLKTKPYAISDARRKVVYETSLNTLRLCLHEHYEDCPWREQSMYIMDTRNQMLCGYYAFDNNECAASAIRLIANGQKENGLFELCFPADVPITIPSFSLAFATMVLEYTEHTRDTTLAKEMMPHIEKMLSYFLLRIDENGLYKTVTEEGIWHFYEWAGVLDGAFFELDGSKKARNEYDSLINAFLSIALTNTAQLCTLLHDFQNTYRYQEYRNRLNARLRETFFVPKTGLFKTYADDREDYSELANALCVLAEACSAEEASVICEKLSSNYDGWTRNTLSMNIFRYDALRKTDSEKYQSVILREIDEVYGYMLDNGATSFWETIKGEADFHFAGSLCHGWSALPVYYYRIFGVCGEREKPIEDAFAIRDIPSRTDYARSVETYIHLRSAEAAYARDAVLAMPLETRRNAFIKMLGAPLEETWTETRLIKKELLLIHDGIRATRYTFLLNDSIPFSGILYEKNGEKAFPDRLIIALHGGGGTSEILGDLFVDSSNYNHMVNRIVRPGIKVFAPQLLLWNSAIYGSENDRENLNRRLTQLGGSITAFELKCLQKTLDWWEQDESTDTKKIGVVGLSYGGMYALHFGALDPRVSVTYSSCWFSDRRKHNWADWTYFNAEHTFFDTEVASLVFPRSLYIEVADQDEAFPAADGTLERCRLTEFARRTDAEKCLHMKVFSGKHELDTDSALLETFIREVTEK